MHPDAATRLLALPDGASVLDVGGWAKPLSRADWVLDLMPYETRSQYGYVGDPAAERFTARTWVQRDMCAREPWPFEDRQFDVAVCSHTLEDVRDPVWVCSELVRVARSGYVEVPSRLEEQSAGLTGPWAGWAHHHWLCDVDPAEPRIDFVFKTDAVHKPGHHFPHAFWKGLGLDRRVERFWWEDGFSYGERVFVGSEELDAYLAAIVEEHGHEVPASQAPAGASALRRGLRRWRRAPRG